ncbi:DUF4124 domain-containing protein [Sinimarinibacterium flocculans]|uniref:DUF4124 domain-containing protein n=1 Tax=Sinimarinibacterium flocculans TaxID=985250 RepID=UPI003517EE0C
MPIKTGSFALLLLAAAFSAGAGQVYKWVDAEGRIHYSDTPRPGWKRVDLKVAPGFAPATTQTPAAQSGAEGEESPERAKLRAEECDKRREQLETYRKATTITERDSLGNERTYSEDERLQLIEQTQKQVSELCRSDS